MENENKVDLRGYGGKEAELASLFGHTVCDARSYDAIAPNGDRFEYKKGLQAWLDLRKWVDLSEEDATIVIRFVRFDKGTGAYIEHRDLTYGEVAALVPARFIDGARVFLGSSTQIKHPFYAFRNNLG
jgi:hypothetical protein